MSQIKIKPAVIAIMIVNTLLSAQSNLEDIKKEIYSSGVKDTLMIVKQRLSETNSLQNNAKHLKGYIVYNDASRLSDTEIIRISAIATKLGCDVGFFNIEGNDSIVFSEFVRKPDAVALSERLGRYSVLSKVTKIDAEAKVSLLVGSQIILNINKQIEAHTEKNRNRIVELEKYVIDLSQGKKIVEKSTFAPTVKEEQKTNCKPIEKIVYKKQLVNIDLSNLQIVNRVVTSSFLDKHKTTAKELQPLNNTAIKNITKHSNENKIKEVTENIKKTYEKPIPNMRSFKEVYNYLLNNAVITKNNSLLLHGRIFNENDIVGEKWKIQKIVYESGVVVVNNYHLVSIKKEN